MKSAGLFVLKIAAVFLQTQTRNLGFSPKIPHRPAEILSAAAPQAYATHSTGRTRHSVSLSAPPAVCCNGFLWFH